MKLPLAAALAAALLSAGCSHRARHAAPSPEARIEEATAEARRELRAGIRDPARAAKADEALVRLQGTLLQTAAALRASRLRLDALDRRHDATAEEFRAVLAADEAARLEQIRGALAIREELAALLSPEEWRASADARRKLLELQLEPQSL